jgi:metal-dependent amidase/aminoacylase/carboxypeptidase family protein
MILELSKKYQPYMVELRRHLHMHPELSLQEFETSKLVQRELEKLGIPFEVIPGSTSVMATIQGGKPGKTIALRADMDALPGAGRTSL